MLRHISINSERVSFDSEKLNPENLGGSTNIIRSLYFSKIILFLYDTKPSKILEKYTNNGSLDIMSYFENVFLKNIDIWGFIMIYITFYEYLYNNFDNLNKYQIEFITKIKYIIIHFLYESPLEPINVSSLVDELTNLNTIIENFNLNNNIGGFITKQNLKQNRKLKTRKRR